MRISDNFKSGVSANKLKFLLRKMYCSKNIQYFYIVLIALCLVDFITACIYFESYFDTIWAVLLDLSLNLVIIIDSVLRIGLQQQKSWKSSLIEVVVILCSIPEVVFIMIYLFFNIRKFEFVSLVLTGAVILIRPTVFWTYRKKSKINSFHLPTSLLKSEKSIFCDSAERMDIIDNKDSLYTNDR